MDNISSPNVFQTTSGGDGDAFIAKFTSTGSRVWGTYYGGSGEDYALAIATDSKGNVIAGGETVSLPV